MITGYKQGELPPELEELLNTLAWGEDLAMSYSDKFEDMAEDPELHSMDDVLRLVGEIYRVFNSLYEEAGEIAALADDARDQLRNKE